MDLTQGCKAQLGPTRKLGQLFIDAMTLTYNNEHLRRRLKTRRSGPALARGDVVLTRKEETNFAVRGIKEMLLSLGFSLRNASMSLDDTPGDRLHVFVQLHNNLFDEHFLQLMQRLPSQLSLYSIDLTQDYACTYNSNPGFDSKLEALGYHIGKKHHKENPSFPTCTQYYMRHPKGRRLPRRIVNGGA
jgi:hypothetical protein